MTEKPSKNKETAIERVGKSDIQSSSAVNLNINLIEGRLEEIRAFQALVQSQLEKDKDYGVIPGTAKPTLLKPGAEKIIKLLLLDDEYEILKEIEDFDKPLFHYMVKCKLISLETGQTISEGLGSCNSMEDKYRYRWLWENQLNATQKQQLKDGELTYKPIKSKKGQWYKKIRTLNEDIYTIANTILKMAEKRAMVDAALSVGRLSNLFTQDMEDIHATITNESTYKSEILKDDTTEKEKKDKVEDKDKDISELVPEEPEEESKRAYKNIPIVLSDGRTKKIDKFEALDYFKKLKDALGELTYYAILTQEGYEKSNKIPPKDIPKVYKTMLDAWGFQQSNLKREEERREKDA